MVKKEDNKEEITAETVLAPDLASDVSDAAQGRVDIRRFTKLNEVDKIWLAYFMLIPPEEGGDFALAFCDNYMNLAKSDEGWGTNKLIQGMAASKGAPSVGNLKKKPGWLGRNVSERGWKNKAEQEGQTVVE